MPTYFTIDGKFYGECHDFTTKQGKPGVNFSVGSYDHYRKRVDYFKCVCYGKAAEIIRRSHQPKDAVSVHGTFSFNEWTNREGNEVKEIQFLVNQVFLSGHMTREAGAGYPNEPGPEEPNGNSADVGPDEGFDF